MKLPGMIYTGGVLERTQTQFGGLNHNRGAGDGELWDMRNLTGDQFPLLASRAQRMRYRTLENAGGLFSREMLCWTAGTAFYAAGAEKGTVTEGPKRFAALGAYIVIFPDKKYYNTATDEFGSLEAEWAGERLAFANGTLYGAEAEANCIQAEGADWAACFRAGDAVTIAGCTGHPENNKTPVIREIDGDKLYFYEHTFTLDGEDGTEEYEETGQLSVRRTVPDLDYLCENENRMWGCRGNTIYASKLGDIFNWNVFEGLATDSYAVETGSAGQFTACISYLGYPVFFKEDHIYKVYGSLPSNFEVMGSATLGVAEGSAESLAIAGETLFYLSRAGVMAYTGGIPQPVGAAFGTERHRNAAAGSDGLKYYVSMQAADGNWGLHVYDTQRGFWHTEDDTHATHFAVWEGNLYFLQDDGTVWITGNIRNPPEDAEAEGPVSWTAEFGDFTEADPHKKGVGRLQLRLELDPGATASAWLQFDTDGVWRQAGTTMQADVKKSCLLPIIPRRGDHYRLKLEGAGGCRVYSLTRAYYRGSELKSKR